MDNKILGTNRQKTIECGSLVDVTDIAKHIGLIQPTFLTSAVWKIINDIPDWSQQSVEDRLEWVLRMLKRAIEESGQNGAIYYSAFVDRNVRPRKLLQLEAVFSRGLYGKPTITVRLLGEGRNE